MTYDENPGIKKCMQFVFGSTLLCKTIRVATEVARTSGLVLIFLLRCA